MPQPSADDCRAPRHAGAPPPGRDAAVEHGHPADAAALPEAFADGVSDRGRCARGDRLAALGHARTGEYFIQQLNVFVDFALL